MRCQKTRNLGVDWRESALGGGEKRAIPYCVDGTGREPIDEGVRDLYILTIFQGLVKCREARPPFSNLHSYSTG